MAWNITRRQYTMFIDEVDVEIQSDWMKCWMKQTSFNKTFKMNHNIYNLRLPGMYPYFKCFQAELSDMVHLNKTVKCIIIKCIINLSLWDSNCKFISCANWYWFLLWYLKSVSLMNCMCDSRFMNWTDRQHYHHHASRVTLNVSIKLRILPKCHSQGFPKVGRAARSAFFSVIHH